MERTHRNNPLPHCAGKQAYASSGEASRAMRGLKRRRNAAPRENLKPYRCTQCSAWHLGTAPKDTLRRAKRREVHDP